MRLVVHLAVLAMHVLVDSPSQRDFLLAERVVNGARTQMLADGSVCGVDGARFRPDALARRASAPR